MIGEPRSPGAPAEPLPPAAPAADDAKRQAEIAAWKALVDEYQKPHLGRAWWQILNTFIPYALCWVAIWFALQYHWWLAIPPVLLASGLLVRVFIIFHDCGHGSFFKSHAANDTLGFISGMFTFTPYYHWRWEHSVHHATAGDLDRRGIGDVWTMTVREYLDSTRWRRFTYRLVRHPFILLVVAPFFLFVLWQRIPTPNSGKRERMSVWWMNLAIVAMVYLMSLLFGFWTYLLLQLAIMTISGSAGIWLFYVQHQFEGVYWERTGDWEYTAAALQGSSFYKLPKILQWFSGNIGFHHLHHLSPRIPNYNLERCHHSDPMFREVPAITLFASLKSLTFRLWDESNRKLVGFRHAHKLHRERKQAEAAAAADAAPPAAPPAPEGK